MFITEGSMISFPGPQFLLQQIIFYKYLKKKKYFKAQTIHAVGYKIKGYKKYKKASIYTTQKFEN